ncbi:hypothetical protein [Mycoplasmopsis gallinacea]|uniref:PTS system, N-acetylgalactosamine-specific, IIA component n=1 Tax=Mycoplasmopsis gallinacea TaxID=29556 RepID=A0A449A2H5_9BACT|nr:hypothetical protein [Mycoplasmopsis gallinacea]VEU58446.1 PTS system, N-acetylgalactosamine-specific, IIA component [Mycoplasmopsis gallinacea]
MTYNILILGHSKYPEGTKSFLEFVGGFEEGIETFHISNENPIEKVRTELEAYFAKGEPTIVTCDLPGGSPHVTIVDLLAKKSGNNVLVYAGLSPALMLDITFKARIIGAADHNEMVAYCKEKFENLNRFSMQNIFN